MLAEKVTMPSFAAQVVDEALAYGETLPDRGRQQVVSFMEQLRRIKKELPQE